MDELIKQIEEKLKAEWYDAKLFFDTLDNNFSGNVHILTTEWLTATENSIDSLYSLAKTIRYANDAHNELLTEVVKGADRRH